MGYDESPLTQGVWEHDQSIWCSKDMGVGNRIEFCNGLSGRTSP